MSAVVESSAVAPGTQAPETGKTRVEGVDPAKVDQLSADIQTILSGLDLKTANGQPAPAELQQRAVLVLLDIERQARDGTPRDKINLPPSKRAVLGQLSTISKNDLEQRVQKAVGIEPAKAVASPPPEKPAAPEPKDYSAVNSFAELGQMMDISVIRTALLAAIRQREQQQTAVNYNEAVTTTFPTLPKPLRDKLILLCILDKKGLESPIQVTPTQPGKAPDSQTAPSRPPGESRITPITAAEIDQLFSWEEMRAVVNQGKVSRTDGALLTPGQFQRELDEVRDKLQKGTLKKDQVDIALIRKSWPVNFARRFQTLSPTFAQALEPSTTTQPESQTAVIDYVGAASFESLIAMIRAENRVISDKVTNQQFADQLQHSVDVARRQPVNANQVADTLRGILNIAVHPDVSMPISAAISRLDQTDQAINAQRAQFAADRARAQSTSQARPPDAIPQAPTAPEVQAPKGTVIVKSVKLEANGTEHLLKPEPIPDMLGIPSGANVEIRAIQAGILIYVQPDVTTLGDLTLPTNFLLTELFDRYKERSAVWRNKTYIAIPQPLEAFRGIVDHLVITMAADQWQSLMQGLEQVKKSQGGRRIDQGKTGVPLSAEAGVDTGPIKMSATSSRIEKKPSSDGKSQTISVVFSGGGQEVRIPLVRCGALLTGKQSEYGSQKIPSVAGGEILEITGRDSSGGMNRDFTLQLEPGLLKSTTTMVLTELGVQPDQQVKDIQSPSGKMGMSEMQGRRSNMEDAHQYIESFMNDPNRKYLAIFDGHGGRAVALQASNRLHQILEDNLRAGINPDVALNKAFMQMDKELAGADEAGATAVVGYIDGSRLWVANIGDARAVASKNGKAECLTFDHKAKDKKEQQRIESAGGEVYQDPGDQPRVRGVRGGGTAVARAFGDHNYKGIIAEPHLQSIEIKDLEFVVLACDGVWDVLSNQDVIDLVNAEIKKGETDPKKLSDLIIQKAYDDGSLDNISASVLLLK